MTQKQEGIVAEAVLDFAIMFASVHALKHVKVRVLLLEHHLEAVVTVLVHAIMFVLIPVMVFVE